MAHAGIHPGRFDGKAVVVTGAAQGIGAAVAKRIAAEGGEVVIADRSPFAQDVADEIATAGGSAAAIMVDLETYEGADRLVAHTLEVHGRVDVLINNVGGTIWTKPYEHYAIEEIEQEIRRSLFPALWCCRAALRPMIEQGKGVIVNVSSIATRSINRVPYAAAKGGVNALTASLALEAAGKGVRVVATAPGGTEAPSRRVPRNTGKLTEQDRLWYQQMSVLALERSRPRRSMTMHPVVSTTVLAVGYEPSTRTVCVQFRSRGIYDYFGIDSAYSKQMLLANPWRRVGSYARLA